MIRIRWPAWLGTRAAQVALGALAVAFVVTQFAIVFTESVNWDEFSLFERAEDVVTAGTLRGGGRPGLGTLAAAPFVDGCTATMSPITSARLVWCGLTFAILAGVFFLVRGAVRDQAHRWHAAALGVAAIALVPVFLRWSVQVRTDQPAIAAALWGGVAILASRRRPALAAAGGALFAFAYLFSQKAIYVIGLTGIVALGDLFVEGGVAWRREARRAVWLAVGAGGVMLAWHLIVPRIFVAAPGVSVGRGLDSFARYRKLFGYRLYRSMLPTLYPQLALLALVAVAAAIAYRRRLPARKPLLISLALVAAGLVVGKFHAATFPYFWMTLGLFPACAIAIGWPGIAATWPRARPVIAVVAWAWLLWIAVPYRAEVLEDTQAIQRRSFAFVERNFPASTRGFHADGGLFCRPDPAPMPAYLRESVETTFTGAEGPRKTQDFITEFRTRPIAFIVEDFLLDPFPREIREFWATHYVRYAAAVAVAGRAIAGQAGTTVEMDVVVPGAYRWHGPVPISVDGREVLPGATLELAAGAHAVVLGSEVRQGALVLALSEPPVRDYTPFHTGNALLEIGGYRREW